MSDGLESIKGSVEYWLIIASEIVEQRYSGLSKYKTAKLEIEIAKILQETDSMRDIHIEVDRLADAVEKLRTELEGSRET